MATFSAENIIRQKMVELDCSADFLSAVVDISASKLSQAFRGVRTLENRDAEHIFRLLRELEELRDSFSPVPIKFENAATIKDLLRIVRDRKEHSNTAAYSVRFGNRWFVRKLSSGAVEGQIALAMSPGFDLLTATKIVASLQSRYADAAAVRNPFAIDAVKADFKTIWCE